MHLTDLLLRLRALFDRRRAESELDEELAFHLEMEARKNRAAGMAPTDAHQSARVHFGGLDQVRETCRDVRGLTFLENLGRDVRYGWRVFRKSPVFTVVAVLSLAIGIGANTAVFSLVETILLRILPVRNPEQLVIARWGADKDLDLTTTGSSGSSYASGEWERNVFSWPTFCDIRKNSRTLDAAIGFAALGQVNVAAHRQAFPAGAMVASGNYFQMLGVGTVLGRTFTDSDDATGGPTVAVLSYRFWDRFFGLDPAAIGKTLYVNGHPCIVIGVTPKDFFGLSVGGLQGSPEIDVTLPLRTRGELEGSTARQIPWFTGDLQWVQVIGRLHQGSSEAAVKSELASFVTANLSESPRRKLGASRPRIYIDPGARGLDRLRSVYRRPLYLLTAITAATLLIACANLAALLLARAGARQHEFLLRLAVGAGRARVIRQLLVEGALLAAMGTVAGLAFAYWGVRALLALLGSSQYPIPVVSPNAQVLSFTAGIALLTTVLFALAPAIHSTRINLGESLKRGASIAKGRSHIGPASVLLALQVVVALVLVAGATLLARSLSNLRSVPLGFNPQHLVLFDLAPGKNGYDVVRGQQLYTRVLERLERTRGVTGATLSQSRLLSGYSSNNAIELDGAKLVECQLNLVGPQFSAVTGISVLLGRDIEPRDIAPSPRIALINETLARTAFGSGSPLGRRFRWSDEKSDVEVVGVVKDAKYDRLRNDIEPTVYVPYPQLASWFSLPPKMTFEVRTAGPLPETIAAIRRAVADIDPMLPLTNLKTQEAQIDDSLAQERLLSHGLSLFGAITLALACVGLYGSVSYSVARRTRELGIRIALGAGRVAVLRMLLRHVLLTLAAGLALGLPLTWALTRFIESQLFNVQPHDPLSLAIACALVAGIGLFAALIPARRAVHIDPVRALHYE